jgi:hypothetical protein
MSDYKDLDVEVHLHVLKVGTKVLLFILLKEIFLHIIHCLVQ